ncbi:MAG TPA: hypothetical protein VLD57_10945 [Blastocatellia bacterium]|nr:hypothetical protein [Blastocatellia bacterium]
MSRLDDELRLAYRRREPPPDFLDRVMSEVAAPPVAKRNWRQIVLSLFQPPRIRWVAIGFATAMAVMIGSLQYQNVQQSDGSKETAVVTDAPPAPVAPPALPDREPDKHGVVIDPVDSVAPDRIKKQPRKVNRLRRPPVDNASQLAQKEGEAAKERLMLALHIASQTLNEAQKIIRED